MIKCIAIDDEPLALEQTVSYISRIPFLQLLASYNNAFEAMKILSEKEIDLVFSDIHMPGLNGIELIQSLIVKPFVVFTTAHPEHAIDGFRVDAVDYLLKPYDFHEFLRAADKARKQIEFRSLESSENVSEQLHKEDSLFVKADSKVIRINIADIKYIEAVGEYVRIYVEGGGTPIETMANLRKLEERLPNSLFMRIHPQYIVNLQKIIEVFRSRIILGNQVYLPIGENYKEAFNAYISKISVNK